MKPVKTIGYRHFSIPLAGPRPGLHYTRDASVMATPAEIDLEVRNCSAAKVTPLSGCATTPHARLEAVDEARVGVAHEALHTEEVKQLVSA